MACGGNNTDSIMNQLNALASQINNGSSCCPPCCPSPPCCGDNYIYNCVDKPYVQCTMLCPPPCMIPTQPCPVKPLQLPCPQPSASEHQMTEEEAINSRHANFYNNYNVDYRTFGHEDAENQNNCSPEKKKGTTLDGGDPCCEDYTKKRNNSKKKTPIPGCPTGFKPCTMKLTPPPNCDPAGLWIAQVQPCPPKPPKKVSNVYKSGECKRPGCKHWESKEGPCLYDEPCKAHCFNHPPGMKPKKKH